MSPEAAAARGGQAGRLFVSSLLSRRPQGHGRDSETHDGYDLSLCLCAPGWSQTCQLTVCPLSSDSVQPLLSPSVHDRLSAPSASFDLTYDLGLVALCADFRENIEFQFSLGWTALVARFIGASNAKRALGAATDVRPQVGPAAAALFMRPRCLRFSSSPLMLFAGNIHLQGRHGGFHSDGPVLRLLPSVHGGDGGRWRGELMFSLFLCSFFVSYSTHTRVHGLLCACAAGVALCGLASPRSVLVSLRAALPVREAHLDGRQQGARPEAAVCGARRSSPEGRRPRRRLRLQPAGAQVRPPGRPRPRLSGLRLWLTCSLCLRELASTFGRLAQRVDLSEAELEGNIRQLSFRIQRLENLQRRSKAFRSEVTLALRAGQ